MTATVIRGGWGRFIESPLGFSLVSGWAVQRQLCADLYAGSTNPPTAAALLLSFPSPFPANLDPAGNGDASNMPFPIHYKDPSVQQWNLTFEHDLGHDIGMRLSYTGSHGINLENFNDLNQVPANTRVCATSDAAVSDLGHYSERGEPGGQQLQQLDGGDGEADVAWAAVPGQLCAHAGSVECRAARFRRSLLGAGGNWVTDKNHPRLDYGNVMFDRRHRCAGYVPVPASVWQGSDVPAQQRAAGGCAGRRMAVGRRDGVPERGVPHHGAGVVGFGEHRTY